MKCAMTLGKLPRAALAAGLSLFALTGQTAHGAEPGPFGGKRIMMYSTTNPGGGFDLYNRLVARHIGHHIPGAPAVAASNMTGAGGLQFANFLYNQAERDGTQMGLLPAYILLESLYGNDKALFDPRRFIWVGNMNQEVDHCSVWHTSGIAKPEDFFSREVVLGASGAGAGSFTLPMVMNAVMGTKFKVILGFSSQSERGLAMERGEIQGQCGTYLSSIKATNMQQVNSGQLRLIWQMGSALHPDFPNLPAAIDYAKTDRARNILKMFFATMAIGRATALPPEVPADRVAMLRAAYDATMRDAAFLAEAAKQKMEIRPMTAADMVPALQDLLGHPAEIYAEAAAILQNAATRAKEQDKTKP